MFRLNREMEDETPNPTQTQEQEPHNPSQNATPTITNETQTHKRKPKKISEVWDHFKPVREVILRILDVYVFIVRLIMLIIQQGMGLLQ